MKPYPDPATNLIYNLLFCDSLALYKQSSTRLDIYPWSILFADTRNFTELQKIVDDEKIESRVKILAYKLLLEGGQTIDKQELHGVIVEVGLDAGLDVLAAFRDGSVRYINYTGKMIIWETSNTASDALIGQLFIDSAHIITRIGPWDKPRRPHPSRGVVRITFLVSDGLYFGEGPIAALFNDAFAGPALMSATKLMQYLTENAVVSHRDTKSTERKNN